MTAEELADVAYLRRVRDLTDRLYSRSGVALYGVDRGDTWSGRLAAGPAAFELVAAGTG